MITNIFVLTPTKESNVKITFQSADFDRAAGTSLQGYVRTTYAELVKMFGKSLGAGDKTTAEWVIEMYDVEEEKYHVITIYDWKMECTPTWEYDWHLGARDHAAVHCFAKLYSQGKVRADWR